MDFGARYYTSGDVPVFVGVDPISDKFPALSTFNYASNKPVNSIDLHGLQSWEVNLSRRMGEVRQPSKRAEGDWVGPAVGYSLMAMTAFLPGPEDAAIAGAAATKFGGSILRGIAKATDKVVDGVSSLFKGGSKKLDDLEGIKPLSDSEMSTISGKGPLGKQTKKELENSKASFESLIEEHLQKIEDFKANPDAFDNKGVLKDAAPELREKIIQGRIKSLEKQIKGQRENLRKVNEALENLDE